ncbi:hypothetical protein M8J75_005292, partial [Diaphorina citri]
FRECLKRADSGAANVVGKLFFNIVQAKCFDLKKEKVCNSSQWFGQCTSYEVQLRAVARDHDPY